ncbi:stage II sporulation protein M [Brevibacillus ruminantium]|uniref:Stage II sporulation protein M n=1 Tax=Brevibacillus ruminantium TaxID=2950604 RepID=A0ABY4WL52_9BACL|nr:stage II sporulation protein M [Brevibacillus ruminantium]USG66094.1 stage II sporulation protein M [Brevibacillus ruminantium]
MKTQLKNLWLDNRKFFLAACLLFAGGAILGFVQAHVVEELAKALFEQLKDVMAKLERNGGGLFAMFWAIFFNNVKVALLMMAMGVFFAFVPVFNIMANGVFIGFMFAKISESGVNPVLMFTAGILPHGIFELPAILFAAAVGIRLGVLSLRTVGSLIQPAKWERVKNDWFEMLRQFPAAVLTVVVLLFVAAFVESGITPLVLHGILGDELQQVKLFQ